MPVTVELDKSRSAVVVRGLQLAASDRQALLQTIGQGELVSVMRTFDESGIGGSWAPLSPVTKRWKGYSDDHKLLMDTGRLRNSIRSSVSGNTITIGTNVKYARVQQEGFHGTQQVSEYTYTRRSAAGDKSAKLHIVNKAGRNQTVTRKVVSGVGFVTVKAHSRKLNIPARPFLIFRPEDPARIREQVTLFYRQRMAA